MNAEETIETLQLLINKYPVDIAAAEEALVDHDTPEPARRVLAGALNYVLDPLDIYPDHFNGLGVVDDAIVLRVGARQAVAAGATHVDLKRLASEAAEVDEVLGDLAVPFEGFVKKLATRVVRGRTVDNILGDKDVFQIFLADLARQIKGHKEQTIDIKEGDDRALLELQKMVRSTLKKEGLLT